jgi:hypothetical protein
MLSTAYFWGWAKIAYICSGCSQDLAYWVFTGQVEYCFADRLDDEASIDD